MNWVGTVSNITVGRFGGGGGVEFSPSFPAGNLAIANKSDCLSLKTVPEFNSFLCRPKLTREVKMTK